MEVQECRVTDFLKTRDIKFVIPVYQRNYDWVKVHCQQLFKDIKEQGENPDDKSSHFIGSMVVVYADDIVADIKEYIIIDGQQRLVTITLIYLAIHNFYINAGNQEEADTIKDYYLINKRDQGKFKLKLTENNQKLLEYLLENNVKSSNVEFARLIENYDFFRGEINEENIKIIENGLKKLSFVKILLKRGKDNPQRIFESLNSTGLALTQADLIRNYILMGLDTTMQTEIYEKYWLPIENNAKDETKNKNLTSDFIHDYLVFKTQEFINQRDVYLKFKNEFPLANKSNEQLVAQLCEIKSLAQCYNKLINPVREKNAKIRRHLEYISQLKITVAYNFLMKVYEDYAKDIINEKTFIAILELIQSFAIRRLILGLPSNRLINIFKNLYDSDKLNRANNDKYLLTIQQALAKKSAENRFPKDKEIAEQLKIKNIYDTVFKKYLLERLENHKNSREQVNIDKNITVEHIFPQNSEMWKEDLSKEEIEEIKDKYLHTIGNLTLSGYNEKLSNKSFAEKRRVYRDSRFLLNREIAEYDKWDKQAIQKRTEIMIERFLEIWQYPNVGITNQTQECNIFAAESPKNKKLDYVIFFDKKLYIDKVSDLYLMVFKTLFAQNKYKVLEFKNLVFTDKSKCRQPMAIHSENSSSPYFIEGNNDSEYKFNKIKLVLEKFGLEDSLLIKYKS